MTPLLLLLAGCGPKAPTVVAPAPTPLALPSASAPAPRAPLLYFAMVDRFANGDPTNDGAVDPADPHAFHGGDLQGVIEHLDHLEALGVTHLWLSPVFEMRTDKIDEWGAFHGYWVRDLTAIEPRFGTEATLAALADGLHDRDMKLLLDMVWNHTDYEAPLRAQRPEWFHDTADVSDWDDPVQRVTGQVHGLPDLAQERAEVRDYLADVSTGWIDRVGVDGYRVDAVGHMPLDALADLNRRLDAHSPGFYTLGEDFSGDPARLARSLEEGGFDAVFDFPLRYAMIDVFCHGAPLGRLAATLSLDRLYADPARLVTFLDNHDLKRVTTECGGQAGRVDAALAFQFLQRGMPALTWGTEVRLPGGDEPANRADLPWEAVPAGISPKLRALADLRTRWPVLQGGRTVVLSVEQDRVVLGRFTPDEAARVVVERGAPEPLSLAPWMAEGAARSTLVSRQVVVQGEALGVTVHALARPPDRPAPWATFLAPPPPQRLVVTAEGDGLRLVGAGPELGHWDPSQGVPFVDGAATVALPGGTAAAFKVVRMTDGGVIWPDGPDRVAALPWEAGETRVAAAPP